MACGADNVEPGEVMQDFSGKVAVVTGAAGGIGYAVAQRLAVEGMKVVLADIGADALADSVRRLKDDGHDVSGCVTDVTSAAAVENLAQAVLRTYGAVHLVCNNAGIGGGAADGRPLWETSEADWKWAFDVNVWGVINGIRSFVPIMRKNGDEGLVVNTASKAGLMCSSSLYSTTKHAVVAISEALYGQLQLARSNIGVAVLCPGAVNTALASNSSRYRAAAADVADDPAQAAQLNGSADIMEGYRKRVQTGIAAGPEPAAIADLLMRGLRNDDFYIIPDGNDAQFQARFDNILARRVVSAARSYPQFQ
jgi:NAD(P)-dependent dehydrogenase (short-subunit alcohol dehydrogenase family)